MRTKDATRSLGSVGYLPLLLLILFVATGAVFACPRGQSKVVYHTTDQYGYDVAYSRCVDNSSMNRDARYGSSADGYYDPGYYPASYDSSYRPGRYQMNYDNSPVRVQVGSARYIVSRNSGAAMHYRIVNDVDQRDDEYYYPPRKRAHGNVVVVIRDYNGPYPE
ncbi:MAG: hypothetical protein JO053_08725 [Acidobacteria bacterium]|nr:hypothetical protein [Acidobacteriota bacterium]